MRMGPHRSACGCSTLDTPPPLISSLLGTSGGCGCVFDCPCHCGNCLSGDRHAGVVLRLRAVLPGNCGPRHSSTHRTGGERDVEKACSLTTRWSGPWTMVGVSCSQWIACSPMRNGGRGRPLNSVVSDQFPICRSTHTSSHTRAAATSHKAATATSRASCRPGARTFQRTLFRQCHQLNERNSRIAHMRDVSRPFRE